MGLAGENENDKKNEVPETTGASTRNLLALATNQQKKDYDKVFDSSELHHPVSSRALLL